MLIKQLFDHDTCTYTYLLADRETSSAVIIDPVVEQVERDLQLIDELGLKLIYTLDTHVHADHVTGSGELRRRTGARSGVSSAAKVSCADDALHHGDTLQFGRYGLRVLSTPGHTDGCITFVAEVEERHVAFTGDALLIRGCGRTDFQGGDAATLYRSVHEQIYSLPDDTIIYPGHDYRGHRSSTVGEERRHNPRLHDEVTAEAFIETMNNLDLAHPKRIHEALPANLGCGLDPERLARLDFPREVSVEELHLVGDARVVDVRSPEEFIGDLGHLPDALLAPLPELTERATAWPRESSILVVCRRGRRSAEACHLLADMGFTDVSHLAGGMTALRAHEERLS